MTQESVLRIHPHSTLLMIGDSITDCGRRCPMAEVAEDLGDGYVSLVHALLHATYPERQIRIVNMGIGGDTVRDLAVRWQSDVLALQPDWLTIFIGINDVWRQFDGGQHPAQYILLDEYAATLEHLIRATRPQLEGLVLMTPYYIEPDRAEPMRALMDRYGAVVRRLAAAHQAVLVDTQSAFDRVLAQIPPLALAADRVHPNLVGHMILARAFLQALGYTW